LRAMGVQDPYEWHAIYELIAVDGHDASSTLTTEVSVQFVSPLERYALLARLLARTSDERPVVVWLDDIQWGHDSLAFVQHVLTQARASLPVVFLLTLRGDLLDEDELLAEKIGILRALPQTHDVEIEPLTPADNAALVEGLLGLSGALAEQVAARTAGHPLFAVQLVGDWVQRGILEVGDQGFVLTPGAHADLPDDLHALWADRIDRILLDVPDASPRLLECAALLGREVLADELTALASHVGVPVPDALVESLVNRQLAVPTSEGWSFAHGMLRESLVRSAREADRWEPLNLAAAAVLASLYDAQRRGISERRARPL